MTFDQSAGIVLRLLALVVWSAYTVRVLRDRHGPDRFRHALVTATLWLYVAISLYRSLTLPPAAISWEVTAISLISLLVGISVVTVRR